MSVFAIRSMRHGFSIDREFQFKLVLNCSARLKNSFGQKDVLMACQMWTPEPGHFTYLKIFTYYLGISKAHRLIFEISFHNVLLLISIFLVLTRT